MKLNLTGNDNQNLYEATAEMIKQNSPSLGKGADYVIGLYDIFNKYNAGVLTSALTCILYNSGINPIQYLNDIPRRCFEYTDLSEFVVPKHIKTIGTFAFSDCENLKSITISEGVTFIDDYAFWECPNLTNIYLPRTLTKMGEEVFKKSSQPITINYNGTIEEWRLIKKSYVMDKMNLTVNCTDGTINN